MAFAFPTEDLTCTICWTIFTDPVTLPCEHSFCRECITHFVSSQHQCPQCKTAVLTDVQCFLSNFVLNGFAEIVKSAGMLKEHGNEKAEVTELCPEHDEKLKLFCVTDQKLTCVICRDGEKHEGHKFKPIKEAAVSLRKELNTFVQHVSDDIHATESQADTQRAEITKTKEKSQQLNTQIHRQFEEMHQFLRKREDEIKNELKYKEEDAVEKMSKMLNVIETALSESRELQGKVTSVLKISDSERLLKSWTEGKSMVTAKNSFRPRGRNLEVVNTSLSLGPYESHLQFFMWKEMLQVIQPRAELLSLKSNSTDITVSEDGQRLFSSPKSNQAQSGSSYGQPRRLGQTMTPPHGYTKRFGQTRTSYGSTRVFDQCEDDYLWSSPSGNHAFSVTEFTSGQHYWEIEVGTRDYWELGIKDHFLKYNGQKYSTCSSNITTELAFGNKPRKIGIYLNCPSKKLSFYDADNMRHIHTMSFGPMFRSLSAYFNVDYNNPDHTPLTVCWY